MADPFVVHDTRQLITQRGFPTEWQAAEYISTLPEHETGRYDLTGPADDW